MVLPHLLEACLAPMSPACAVGVLYLVGCCRAGVVSMGGLVKGAVQCGVWFNVCLCVLRVGAVWGMRVNVRLVCSV